MSDYLLNNDSVYIVGAGAQTPVGRCVLSAAAAVRCGISAYAEHPFMIDRQGEPMVVARAEWLEETLSLEDRITRLAVDAAKEALDPIAAQLTEIQNRIGIHLALSDENLPTPALREKVCDGFIEGMGFGVRDRIQLIAEGHAGGLLALEKAFAQVRGGELDFCLVGGSDSWIDPQRLEAIDFGRRLHSINYSWGFTPGEGAGFCLIATGATVKRLDMKPYAELLAVATGEEPKLLGTETVCIGEGLTQAFRKALHPDHPVSHSYCDFNGETYRADEFGFTICRVRECFEDAGSFTTAAECWGDVGAASGLLSLTLPLAAWERRYAKGTVNLAWGSSATKSLRGAALLRQVETAKN